MRSFLRHAARCLLVAVALVAAADAAPPEAPAPGSLREQFPSGSIDSVARADAALAMTIGAKAHIEQQYKTEARDCMKAFLVNDCLDKARALQRSRLADIETVALEANRYKRRDKADRLDADRVKREADRAANAKADADLRERNRQAFEERQATAARETAQRARSDARRAQPPKPHKPTIKAPPSSNSDADAKQRQKNAADYALKVREADAHLKDMQRRATVKAADRKRRDDEKALKDAKAAAVPKS